jgi:hypothetical protein
MADQRLQSDTEAETRPHRDRQWTGEGVVIWWTDGAGGARAVVLAGLVAPGAAAPVHPLQTAAAVDLRCEQESVTCQH